MTLQNFITDIFNSQHEQKGHQSSTKTVLVLNFLAPALQMMPLTLCCDVSANIIRLTAIEDAFLKTNAYLTIEVLFASRRFNGTSDHPEQVLRQLLDN